MPRLTNDQGSRLVAALLRRQGASPIGPFRYEGALSRESGEYLWTVTDENTGVWIRAYLHRGAGRVIVIEEGAPEHPVDQE